MDFQLPLELFVEDNVGIADNKKGHLKIQDGTCFDPLSSYFKGREKKKAGGIDCEANFRGCQTVVTTCLITDQFGR